ncbi:3'(2'),5'-bisphosphate nucleotidase CysQ [uncultured Draconibacterium sp.]|uniref:3'(2'),5'-bisphosphate nucleotidase CysQ n=1 Tax=uncultured Draconibacterium sp. TaxID=1573823 RepID=UPI002AA8C56B|nr:3'(2'),5'-bisphosphate nucleotidase CysQ [uncultured Draconibacterium sp.]
MEDITLALNAAVRAGEKILEVYNDPNSNFSVERKADNSPLTIADKMSHEVIAGFLQSSSYPVLSEEGKEISYNERKEWQKFWLVDPLDGTKEFIKRNGEFTVNIALVEKGSPVMGVIYVPVTRTLYFGELGTGAWKMELQDIGTELTIDELKEQGIKIPVTDSERQFTVVGSRSHSNEETAAFIKSLEEEHGEIEIMSKGSSLKICMVAEGSADIYPRFGPTMEWDTGAGHAIAAAAGKNVTLADHKTPLKYNKENLLNPFFIVH